MWYVPGRAIPTAQRDFTAIRSQNPNSQATPHAQLDEKMVINLISFLLPDPLRW